MGDTEKLAESVSSLQAAFEEHRYICSEEIATAVFLAYQLRKPILIEGPPGVGKTELAKTAAEMFVLPLIRLQCYEGLDESKAIYEWKYGKQLLYTQVLKEALGEVLGDAADDRTRVESRVDGKLEQLVGLGDLFALEDGADAEVEFGEVVKGDFVFGRHEVAG